jgi:Spx/MgsR family transcriptional regulator
MSLKIYAYKKCGTCRKALKFLGTRGVTYTTVPIREHPPTTVELRQMLRVYRGDLRRLFNTSGQDYRRLKLKEKLSKMSKDKAIRLLASNGNLVKRPFALGGSGGRAGFNELEWEGLLK